MATVYRNLQEQFYENAKDIEELNEKIENKNSISSRDASIDVSTGTIYLNTENAYNDDKVMKDRSLIYFGEYLSYWQREPNITYQYRYTLPTKSGTLALVEAIPVNNGTLKIGNTEITEEQLQKLLQLIAQ